MKAVVFRSLQSFFAILLTLCIVVESTGKAGILIGYVANEKFIAQNLCENRNNPKKHCNGKCYLAKQLKQEDNKPMGQSLPKAVTEREEIIMGLPELSVWSLSHEKAEARKFNSVNSIRLSCTYGDIFHPPA